MQTAAVIDPAEVEAFRRDGFVHLKGLLDPAEVRRMGEAVDAAVTARKRNDTRMLAEKSLYEQSFVQCQYLWEDFPDVRPLTFHPRIVGAAAALIGADAMRLWHDQALYKEAGGRETDPHQDHPYWPIVETDTITAWVPFDGSTLETGAMGYLPGSHRLGVRAFVDIFSGHGEDPLTRNELQEIAPEFVEVPAGSVAFHHGLTFHLAGPNRTGTVRRVHTAIYFADGSTRGEGYYPHPAVERAGIAMGAVIASDITPLAWPLPDGVLPDPPAEPMG
jgi:ectoine hydroxylase-related dioxygenase (phytanoyl-CoA dioxygenase family)